MGNIIIINYGMGNLNSIKKKLTHLKVNAVISSNPNDILNADKLILPGVGHFKKAIENLKALNLFNV
ncbi:MAG: imidazole glycerol phosphate synthase subunit HisH, partial [Bacteroidetes bacterium CG_4_10_14_3_um_filter_31_20]